MSTRTAAAAVFVMLSIFASGAVAAASAQADDQIVAVNKCC
jgi:hypothetical protein